MPNNEKTSVENDAALKRFATDVLDPVASASTLDADGFEQAAAKRSVFFGATTEQADAVAENSTQAAKKLYPGDVSVNLQTGAACVQFSVPAFAGLHLGLSYSSIAARYDSPFMFPSGVNLMGIPFVYKNDAGHRALNLNGQDYYLDDEYASVLAEGERKGTLYHSGLKYQTSQNIFFKNYKKNAAEKIIKIHTREKKFISCPISYELDIYDGAGTKTTFFFDVAGFCIIIVSKFFNNDTPFNYKYVISLAYDRDATDDILYSKLKSVTDANGNRVEITYENRNHDIRFTYPVGASGQPYEVYVLERSSEMVFGHSLDEDHDYRLVMNTEGSWLSEVSEIIYEKTAQKSYPNKRFLLDYTNDQGLAMVSKLRLVDEQDSRNAVTTSYEYSGDREHNFNYGYDRAFDASDIETSRAQYETRVIGGKNQKHHYYNKLSQEIRTETRSIHSTTSSPFGDLIHAVYNLYPKVVQYDSAAKTNRFLANYLFPTEILTVAYDKAKAGDIVPAGIQKKNYLYGDYGNLLSEEIYPAVQFNGFAGAKNTAGEWPDYPAHVPAVTATSNRYDYRYVTLVEQKHTDNTMDKVDILEYRLTADGLNIALTMPVATNIAGSERKSLKSTEYSYAQDGESYPDCNYVDNASILRQKEFFAADDQNEIVTRYTYNLSDGEHTDKYGTLTIKKTVQVKSGETVPEASTTEQRIDGLTVKEIGATNLVTSSRYDVSRNLIYRKCPAGIAEARSADFIARLYKSEIIDANGSERYLSECQVFDFINQLVYKKERCQKNGAVSSYAVATTVYDYVRGGRAVEQCDMNGNTERLFYDAYRGLLQKKEKYQKNKLGVVEYCGATQYEYAIAWHDNQVKNCFAVVSEIIGGEKGQKTVTKGISKSVIYEQTKWVGGTLISRQVNDYSLSGILMVEKIFVTGKSNAIESMKMRSRQQYRYDLLGRTEDIAQELFDETGNAVHSSNMEFEYDDWNVEQDVLRRFVTKEGDISTYKTHYNLLGKEIARSCWDGDRELRTRMTYNAAGDLLQSEDFCNNVTSNHYDAGTGLLGAINYSDGTGRLADSVANSYDVFARVTSQVASNRYGVGESVNAIGLTKSLTFMLPDELAKHASQSGAAIVYDDQNRVARYTDADGLVFTFAYLYSGNLDHVRIDKSQGGQVGTIDNEYYAYSAEYPLNLNKLKNSSIRMNTGNIAFSQTSTFSYDAQGRLKEEASDDGVRRIATAYFYNALNQVIGKNDTVTASTVANVLARIEATYAYNEREQLVGSVVNDIAGDSKTTHSYIYDDFGNIKEQRKACTGSHVETVSVKYTYNNINQLLEKKTVSQAGDGKISSEMVSYRYDNNGNVVCETTAHDSGDAVVDHVYNAQNQLVSVTNAKGTVRYAYYPTGQRALKQKDGQSVLFYYDTSGTLRNSMFVDLAKESASPKWDSYFGAFRYIRDKANQSEELQAGHMRLNSSNCTTIAKAGKSLAYQTHSVSDYGKVDEDGAAGKDQFDYMQYPFLYGAAHYDRETGLQYMQSRYYAPAQARFLAQDNADFENIPNRYTYALSNPVMNYDQDGHLSWQYLAAAVLAGVGLVLAPATAGASEALAYEADALLLAAGTAGEAGLIAAEGVEALSMVRQVGGNALFLAGTNGMSNSQRQMKSGNDFSWGSFGKALGAGAVSGVAFGAVYGGGVKGASKIFGPLGGWWKPKLVNAALYTAADVGAHVTNTAIGNAIGITDARVGISALEGLVVGVIAGSIFSNFSAATLMRKGAAETENVLQGYALNMAF